MTAEEVKQILRGLSGGMTIDEFSRLMQGKQVHALVRMFANGPTRFSVSTIYKECKRQLWVEFEVRNGRIELVNATVYTL